MVCVWVASPAVEPLSLPPVQETNPTVRAAAAINKAIFLIFCLPPENI